MFQLNILKDLSLTQHNIIGKNISVNIAYNASLAQEYLNLTKKIVWELITRNQFTTKRRYIRSILKRLKAPFVISADFKRVLVPSTHNNHNDPNTETYQDHVICSYGYKLMCDEQYSKPYRSLTLVKMLLTNFYPI